MPRLKKPLHCGTHTPGKQAPGKLCYLSGTESVSDVPFFLFVLESAPVYNIG
jgi:hypothetical protein